jgi:orotate phosphoribosyltransferase
MSGGGIVDSSSACERREGTSSGRAAARPLAVPEEPGRRRFVMDRVAAQVQALGLRPELLVSVDTESIVASALLAGRLELPMVYVRPAAKAHGKQRQIEGQVRDGARALLIADRLADDVALARSVEAIREKQGVVVGCLALRSSLPAETIGRYAREGVPVHVAAGDEAPAPHPTPPRWGEGKGASAGDNGRVVAGVLLSIGAVTINTADPYRYVSGILSPIYTDNRLLMSHPEGWARVIDAFVATIRSRHPAGSLDGIAGTATSGIPHAARIAEALELPLSYVTFGHELDAETREVTGALRAGDRVVLIEDLITTGKSAIGTAEALRAEGAVVERCLSIFSYGSEDAAEAFRSRGLVAESLCDLATLLTVGVENGTLSEADRELVLDWVRDPRGWEKRRK